MASRILGIGTAGAFGQGAFDILALGSGGNLLSAYPDFTMRLIPVDYAIDAPAKTYANIAAFVTKIYGLEGGVKDDDLYIPFANMGLADLSERTSVYDPSWDTSASGGLSVSGNIVSLPRSLIAISRVEWNGRPIWKRAPDELDVEIPGWRDRTGTPTRWCFEQGAVVLDAAPGSIEDGQLVVRTIAYLPKWDTGNESGNANPLTYLPYGEDFQLALAFYILGELPIDPEHAASAARAAQYKARYEGVITKLTTLVGRRTRREMS